MAYTAYLVDLEQLQITPQYCNIFMHHITEEFGVKHNSEKPTKPTSVEVVGYAKDDKAEALVVAINGSTQRKDGSIYHITVSTKSGVKPVYSNQLLQKGWDAIDKYAIDVEPAVQG